MHANLSPKLETPITNSLFNYKTASELPLTHSEWLNLAQLVQSQTFEELRPTTDITGEYYEYFIIRDPHAKGKELPYTEQEPYIKMFETQNMRTTYTLQTGIKNPQISTLRFTRFTDGHFMGPHTDEPRNPLDLETVVFHFRIGNHTGGQRCYYRSGFEQKPEMVTPAHMSVTSSSLYTTHAVAKIRGRKDIDIGYTALVRLYPG